MSRPLRIDYEGAFHHVTARGVARQAIFLNDDDRQAFLKRLAELKFRWGVSVHAYCLMPNHYHLEVETSLPNLSASMKWFNHVYASYFNWRHARVGHVFQGRFKSALVEADTHLCALTRYIHMNPVRARLAAHPADYLWSSYRAYIGLSRRPEWLQTGPTLRRFAVRVGDQIRAYRSFVEEEVADDPLRDLAFGVVIGSPGFADWVRDKLRGRKPDPNVPDLRRAAVRPSLEKICAIVAERYGVSEKAIPVSGKKRNLPRAIAIYLAREFSGRGNCEIGTYFGGITAAAVSVACLRIEKRALTDRSVRRALAHLSPRIASVAG